MAKIERSQKLFLKALKEKFAEDPASTSTPRMPAKGLKQSPRKREFVKEGKKVEMDPWHLHVRPRSAATSAVSRSASAS